jgi:hypothetical protein
VRRFDEDVEVLRGARSSVEGDGVRADDEVADAMGIQRGDELFVIAGRHRHLAS